MSVRWKSALLAVLVGLVVLPCTAPASSVASSPLKEISYYGRDYAWLEFWPNWPAAKVQMDDDLDVIAGLGFNTVRIFLHPAVFGYPTPTAEYQGYFAEAVELIDAHGLQAHVNLFDCWWGWADIEGSKSWLAEIVYPYRNDNRIALWELQNEVNRDPGHPDWSPVRNWIQELFPYLKQQAGSTPATVSVGDVEWLDDIRDLTYPDVPDIYSLHWYPASLRTWTTPLCGVIDRARELIPDGELLLGEFGFETCTLSEASQRNLYRDVFCCAEEKGVVHLGVWTYSDFPDGTEQCEPGSAAPPEELHFGLFRLDGSPKPALAIVPHALAGIPLCPPGPPPVLNPSFEDLNPYCGQMDNWLPWDETWSWQPTFEQDCAVANGGRCSARVPGIGGLVVGLYTVPALPAQPQARYNLQAQVMIEDLDGWVEIALAWFDADGAWLGDARSGKIVAANQPLWTPLAIEDAEPPPDAVYVEVYLQMLSTHSDTTVWFDDVVLTPPWNTYLPLALRQPAAAEQRYPLLQEWTSHRLPGAAD
jgi:hypothetical protein